MNSPRISAALRKPAKWLALALVLAFVVFRMKFAATPVQVFDVKPGMAIGEVMGTGTLEARVKTTISPRIQERLAEVLVDQGDQVNAGQLLVRLDDGELRRQVEVADATLASAKATAERVQVDEARAQAVEQQARQNHQRVAELVSQQVSSQAERDKAVEQLHVAESDLRRARAATVEAQQQINLAEKTLAYQHERLTFTRIISPYDGLVTRRDRDPGGVVVPGSSLLQLVSTNEFWVSAWVDETAASALTTGQSTRVVFRSDPERTYPGEVARKPTARRANSSWTSGCGSFRRTGPPASGPRYSLRRAASRMRSPCRSDFSNGAEANPACLLRSGAERCGAT
jgi:HlyD family secretion protein